MSRDVRLTDDERWTYRCPVVDDAGDHFHPQAVESLLSARLAAERERIAEAIEALPCPGSPPAPLARYAYETAKEHAARIARGGSDE